MMNPDVRDPFPLRVLSDREVDVLVRWVADKPLREIARALFISDATVRTHLVRIRAKYREAGRPANSKIALLVRAIEDGYITLNEVAASIDGGRDRQVRLVQQRAENPYSVRHTIAQ